MGVHEVYSMESGNKLLLSCILCQSYPLLELLLDNGSLELVCMYVATKQDIGMNVSPCNSIDVLAFDLLKCFFLGILS